MDQFTHRQLGISRQRQLHPNRVLPTLHSFVFNRDAGGIRDRRIDPHLWLDRPLRRRPTAATKGQSDFWPVCFWSGDARADLALAEVLLSVRLDFARFDFGVGESMPGSPQPLASTPIWRLAAGRVALARRVGLRVLLGDVELLFLSEVDLSYARRTIPPHFRNAVAGLRRLHSLRARAIWTEEFSLAPLVRVKDLKSTS